MNKTKVNLQILFHFPLSIFHLNYQFPEKTHDVENHRPILYFSLKDPVLLLMQFICHTVRI
jgi:hypothetical protein